MVFSTVKEKAGRTRRRAERFAENQKLFLQENIPAEKPSEDDFTEEFNEQFGDVFGIEPSKEEEEVELTGDDFL